MLGIRSRFSSPFICQYFSRYFLNSSKSSLILLEVALKVSAYEQIHSCVYNLLFGS
jgi:hypothetical protein